MHRLAFLAFIIGGFPLHCVQRTMSFLKDGLKWIAAKMAVAVAPFWKHSGPSGGQREVGKVEEGESLGGSGNTHHEQTHKKQRTTGGLTVHCTD